MTIQDLDKNVSAYADSSGNATFTFEAIPLSQTWTFTATIPGAEDTAVIVAASGASTYGQWKGSNSWGPIQLGTNDQLILTVTGLSPGQLYIASIQGYVATSQDVPPVYPVAYADTVTTNTQQIVLYNKGYTAAQWSAGSGSVTYSIPIPPGYRSIIVTAVWAGTITVFPAPGITITATGNVTGATYQGFTPPYLVPTAVGTLQYNQNVVQRFAVIQGNDTALNITITSSNPTGGTNFYVSVGADLTNVDTLIYAPGTAQYNSQSNPGALAVGQPWSSSVVTSPTPSGYSVTPYFQTVLGGSQIVYGQITSTSGVVMLPAFSATDTQHYYRLHSCTVSGGAAGQFVYLQGATAFIRVSIQGVNTNVQLNGQLISTTFMSTVGLVAVPSAYTAAINVNLTYDIIRVSPSTLNQS